MEFGTNELNSQKQSNLKVIQNPKVKKTILDGDDVQPVVEDVVDEPVSFKDVVKVTLTLMMGYILFAIAPTVLLMKVFEFGFWLSTGFTFILAVILALTFGLHKPASAEQLAKRDMYKKRRK